MGCVYEDGRKQTCIKMCSLNLVIRLVWKPPAIVARCKDETLYCKPSYLLRALSLAPFFFVNWIMLFASTVGFNKYSIF